MAGRLGMVGSNVTRGDSAVGKAYAEMDEPTAAQFTRQYGTVGPLPKTLDRNQRMKAYEARYVASGGKKAEKWSTRTKRANVARNISLVGATTSAAGILAARGKRTGAFMRKTPGLKKLTPRRLETTALGFGTAGGAAELYGERAGHKRASYANSAGGVAASALTRMRNYTPSTGA